MKIVVFAASLTSINILEVLIDQGSFKESQVAGILDDNPELAGSYYHGFRILGRFADIASLRYRHQISHFAIGIGSPYNLLIKRYTYEQCIQMGLQPVNAIHQLAYISPRSSIGEGNLILPFTTISCHVQIGSNCVIPPCVSIMEGTKIGDHVQIHGHSFIAGNCQIEENVYIGPGSTISTAVRIGSNSVIGAGSLVLKDVPPNSFCFGTPVMEMRRNNLFREVNAWPELIADIF